MTDNVRGLRLGVDRVAAVIDRQAPDLVFVQASGPRRAFRRLARTLNMEAAADPIAPWRRRIQNAVLVRPPVRIATSRLVRFSTAEPWYPRAGTGDGATIVVADRALRIGYLFVSADVGMP